MNGGKLLLLLLVLSILPAVSAVGIAPATASLSLEQDAPQTLTFYAVNSGPKELEVEVYADGDLAPYVKFSETKLKVAPGQLVPFTVTITIPKDLPAGRFATAIGVREVASQATGTGFTAQVAAQSQLTAENPNGPVLLSVKMTATNVSAVGQSVFFALDVKNPTPYGIGPVQGQIAIYDSSNREFAKSDLTVVPLVPAQNSTRMTGIWETGQANYGIYKAVATLTYDRGTTSANATFQIGRPFIEIIQVEVTQQNNIAKVIVKAHNLWTDKISEVYSTAQAYYQGAYIGAAQSNRISVGPGEIGTMEISLDLLDRSVNETDFDVTIYYSGYETKRRVGAKGYIAPTLANGTITGSFAGQRLEFKPTYTVIILLMVTILVLTYLYNREPPKQRYYGYYYRR